MSGYDRLLSCIESATGSDVKQSVTGATALKELGVTEEHLNDVLDWVIEEYDVDLLDDGLDVEMTLGELTILIDKRS